MTPGYASSIFFRASSIFYFKFPFVNLRELDVWHCNLLEKVTSASSRNAWSILWREKSCCKKLCEAFTSFCNVFFKISLVCGRFWTDPFGSVWTCWDVTRCVRTHSEASGRFQKNSDLFEFLSWFSMISDVFLQKQIHGSIVELYFSAPPFHRPRLARKTFRNRFCSQLRSADLFSKFWSPNIRPWVLEFVKFDLKFVFLVKSP